MRPEDYKNWNEFEWERELRRDDLRIRAYMETLPKFIDLPGEDDLLIKRLQKIPELLPQEFNNWTDTPYASVFGEDNFDPDDIDEDFFLSEVWKEEEDADILIIMQKITKEWTYNIAMGVYEDKKASLRIVSLLGLQMSILIDIIQIKSQNVNGLVIALAKRALNNINTLVQELKNIVKTQIELKDSVNEYILQLHEIRERLVDIIFSAKTKI